MAPLVFSSIIGTIVSLSLSLLAMERIIMFMKLAAAAATVNLEELRKKNIKKKEETLKKRIKSPTHYVSLSRWIMRRVTFDLESLRNSHTKETISQLLRFTFAENRENYQKEYPRSAIPSEDQLLSLSSLERTLCWMLVKYWIIQNPTAPKSKITARISFYFCVYFVFFFNFRITRQRVDYV